MAGSSVRITWNQQAINTLLLTTTGLAAGKAAQRTVDRARSNLAAKGRVRTGALSASIQAKVVNRSATVTKYEIGSRLKYAIFQEKGIGPVHARRGGVLRFKPKGSNVFIFRPRTRGFAGAFYLEGAARQLSISDFL